MVKAVFAVSHKGLTDWLVQRVSAIILALYFSGLFFYVLCQGEISYETWRNLFTPFWMKLSTLLCLAALLFHAWIGVWTILTDYVKNAALNLFLQMIILLSLIVSFFAGLLILWSI